MGMLEFMLRCFSLLVFVVFCLLWLWMGTLMSLVVLSVIVWFDVFVMYVAQACYLM